MSDGGEGGVSRRQFLKQTSLYGGSLVLTWNLPRPQAARAAAASAEPVTLNASEWRTLEAITARILPTDHEPGAREAGCVNFIDKALAHEDSAALPLYRGALAAVEAFSANGHGKSFAELEAAQQDALLRSLQQSALEGWPGELGESGAFFEVVRQHTLLGFLADPSYGGNRDMVGWKVARYPGPRHRRGGYTPEQVRGAATIETAWGEELQVSRGPSAGSPGSPGPDSN